jgi:hypothetical protein
MDSLYNLSKMRNKSWIQNGFWDGNVSLSVELKHVTKCPCDFTYMMVLRKTIRKKVKEFDSAQLTPNRSNNLL